MHACPRPICAMASLAVLCLMSIVTPANAENEPSTDVPESRGPSITVQDQSRRLLSPGFRLKQVTAQATGKHQAELHLEDDRVYGEQNLFRSNQPPLLLRTAAYGLSQAVKLADHKIAEDRHPLLIDAMTSRDASLNSPRDQAAACKYCRRNQSVAQVPSAPRPDHACPTECDSQTAPKPLGSESRTVQELVDLMESLGPGVLEGSVFGPEDVASDEYFDERQTLIQNLEVTEARGRNSSACQYCTSRFTEEDV